LIEEVNKLF